MVNHTPLNVQNTMTKLVSIIVAATKSNLGIGYKNNLPWHLPSDMKYFKRLTSQTQDQSKHNAVIMGRKTWDSIPLKFRPLSGRLNVILSRNPNAKAELDLPEEVVVAHSLDEALAFTKAQVSVEKIFIIGGGSIYAQAIESHRCDRIYLTSVVSTEEERTLECDTFFPASFQHEFTCASTSAVEREKGLDFCFQVWNHHSSPKASCRRCPGEEEERRPHEEMQYLDLIQKIIREGTERQDRTGTGTLSLFGAQMRFSLRDGIFPLLTTKRVFWRGVAEELLWFISGDTSAKTLQDKNIKIWDGNGSREYLDSLGHTERETGDLGPVYGFQWRHFGAKYTNMHADYTGQGHDQLAEIISQIKSNPTSRRIVLSAWNPCDLGQMALPPCHVFCQFYVANGELSCQMYQRSADMGLGVPFNIASYALLTVLLARVTNLKPGEFVHSIGDAHVYLDHVEPLKEQLRRTPRAFPTLTVRATDSIDDFVYDDFQLDDYTPHKSIKMNMSV